MARKSRKLIHPQRFLLNKIVSLLRDADAKIVVRKRADAHEMDLIIPPATAPDGAQTGYEMVYRLGVSFPEPLASGD